MKCQGGQPLSICPPPCVMAGEDLGRQLLVPHGAVLTFSGEEGPLPAQGVFLSS